MSKHGTPPPTGLEGFQVVPDFEEVAAGGVPVDDLTQVELAGQPLMQESQAL